MRDAVVFPGTTVPLSIGRARSLAALEEAGATGLVLVGTQRDARQEEPGLEELHPVATIAKIIRVTDARQSAKQAIVIGVVRARFAAAPATGRALRASVTPLVEPREPSAELDAARARVVELSHRLIDLRDDYPDEWKQIVSNMPSPGLLADLVASSQQMPSEQRIGLLCEPDPIKRLWVVAGVLEREATIAQTQRTLREREEEEPADPKRRERLLRRRMRDIQEELGEAAGGEREADELAEKLEAAQLPEVARTHAERELRRFRALAQHAPDRHLLRTYLEWLADLPWAKETEDHLDIADARRVLDEDHHGLAKVKDRILEYLAVRKLAPSAKAPILCFVGPPGVGKTSLGKSIARAMGRKLTRASLGGVRDEAEIRGHRRTYVGSMPGRILQSLRRAGSRNPGLPARRGRQARRRLPRRPVLGAARSARPRAEQHVQRPLPRGAVRPVAACSSSRPRTRSRRSRPHCSIGWR